MKYIQTSELVKGDIFTEEVKLKGRKAYLVVDIVSDTLVIQDRDDNTVKSKKIHGHVAFLRHIDV